MLCCIPKAQAPVTTTGLFRWTSRDLTFCVMPLVLHVQSGLVFFNRNQGSYFGFFSLCESGWGPPKFERAPQIKSLKLVCVVVENKKISRDVKGLFFLGVISSRWIKSSPRSAIVPLQLVGELLRKRGVVSWIVSWAYGTIWAKVL